MTNQSVISMRVGQEKIIPDLKSSGIVKIDFNQSVLNWISKVVGISAMGQYQYPERAADDLNQIVSAISVCEGQYEDDSDELIAAIKKELDLLNSCCNKSPNWEDFIGKLFSVMEDFKKVNSIKEVRKDFSGFNNLPPFDSYAFNICLVNAIFKTLNIE